MFFTVVEALVPQNAPPETAYLVVDNWDDLFSYRTMFTLVVVDSDGVRHQPGSVKIGQRGMRGSPQPAPGQRSPELPQTFEALGNEFFSLGQDDTYYESLNQFPVDFKLRIFNGLRDLAFNPVLYGEVVGEDVVNKSLLRYVNSSYVRGRFHRLAHGNAVLTEFHFKYALPGIGGDEGPILTFDVRPNAQPPTNVHVLIGRNGVGKTRLMQGLTRALLHPEVLDDSVGEVEVSADGDEVQSFAGLVMVSFSAFDDFDLVRTENDSIKAVQVGLRSAVNSDDVPLISTKSPYQLAMDFVESLQKCRVGLRAARWKRAVSTLEQDDLFAEANVTQVLGSSDTQWRDEAVRLFVRLSSGHKIILLTITKLVEHVDERTLVLLDEPEAHLHPPLLAAFIRSLSDLLVSRNGVALIATHSPVVLQEVPKSCVWKIWRDGRRTSACQPESETFAENVSDLTREIFNLEITKSGFHQLIADAVSGSDRTYEQILAAFRGQLGAEGRALARALVAERDSRAEA